MRVWGQSHGAGLVGWGFDRWFVLKPIMCSHVLRKYCVRARGHRSEPKAFIPLCGYNEIKYKLLLLKSTLRADPDMAAGPMGSFRLGTGFVRSLYCIFIVSESMSLF